MLEHLVRAKQKGSWNSDEILFPSWDFDVFTEYMHTGAWFSSMSIGSSRLIWGIIQQALKQDLPFL